ncbi:hypothetical protein QBC44DRAFT_370430 [Cladorrhinum sp. PSN332]|nr:hypothetical protein QBC44DRAFT_370430 [Cladorrhinum sp. PSN332]
MFELSADEPAGPACGEQGLRNMQRIETGIRFTKNPSVDGSTLLRATSTFQPLHLDTLVTAYELVVVEPSGGFNIDDIFQAIGTLALSEPELDDGHSQGDQSQENRSQEEDVSGSDSGDDSSLESSVHTFSFSSSASEVSYVGAALSAYQREVVESLMREFGALFYQDFANGSGRVRASLGSSSAASQGSGSSSPGRAGANDGPSDNRGLPNLPGSGSGGGTQGPASLEESLRAVQSRKLACPYYKREPWKHNKHRSCTGPGWPAIHRVKEHITRVHALPIYCRRCGDQFTSDEDLETHSRAAQACAVRTFDKPEGFTKDQERLLKKKRKSESSDDSDKWRAMYRILFPDDDENDIPSPYYDSDDAVGFDQYERYLRREVPRVVRRRLEVAAAAIAVPVENELRAQLVDIIRSSQTEAFEGFRRMVGQSPTRTSAALLPSESIASIISAPVEPNLPITTGTEEVGQNPVGNDAMYLFDFSAFSPPPVVEDTYVTPETVLPGSAVTGLFRDYPPTAPDSGYGSNTALQGTESKKTMLSLEGWDGGPEMEGSSNWWMPVE